MAAEQSYPSCIPINVNDLLALQGVESQRVEFKKAWHNDRRIKGGTYWQVIHTISAFANDYYNVNGGYIIIGVEEKKNRDSSDKRDAVPCGIQGNLETIQKEIAGACRGNIKPPYVPRVQPEVVDSEEGRKEVLVIWVKPSETRPHMCRESDKGEMKYYIRHNAETKVAQEEEIKRLCLENSTPFDDRAASDSGKKTYSNRITLAVESEAARL